MNILSLFDGISCGQVAINRIGIKSYKYFSSEIDKYAIQITQKNYPNTIQLGDIKKILYRKGKLYSENGNFSIGSIDLLIGGSPCQGFSFAGKQLNFEDLRSALFFEFVRLLEKCKPKYFLLENVRMKKEYQDIISSFLGVEPIMINSSLVSAQNRKRLYWTNISNVKQPKDKGILLKDILENGVVDRNKSYCLLSIFHKSTELYQYAIKSRNQLIFNNKEDILKYNLCKERFKNYNRDMFNKECDKIIKQNSLRRLMPIECERLQTLPDNYAEGISNTQRYKCIGNGWTVDIIAHILKNIKE